MFYATDTEELKVLIDRLSKEKENIKPDYIVSDLQTHKAVLAELMGTQ